MKVAWILGVFLFLVIKPAQSAYFLRMEHTLRSSYLLADAHLAIKARHFDEAEALLKNFIESNPKHDEASFWLAKVHAWQKHYDESTIIYQKLLEREPDNTDYRLGQAQVLVWSGKSKEALPLISSAERLNPSDPDILRLHIQVLLSMGDVGSNSEAVELQRKAELLFPQQTWKIDTKTSDTPILGNAISVEKQPLIILDALDRSLINEHNNQVGIGYTYESFSNGRGNGHAEYLEFEHRFAPRAVVYGMMQQSDRFGNSDLQLLIGGYYPLPSGMTLNVEGNLSASHKMVPKNSQMASLQLPITTGWYITGGLRHSQYSVNTSYQEFGLLEWYFSDYRAAYTLTSTQALGTTLFGNRISISRYYNDISFVTLSLSEGREVEGTQYQNVFFSTASIGLNGRHWFNKDWAINWSVGGTQQDTAYTRTGGNVGLRYAF
ncbi:beta-barrel assembly-enhancing protease [mine drainage metagenome]|uniref:Beta-barrel assembly-enhancing protease n=1 Tax=mine drainage metagenome TaxID=410659 RepID=A0A1J5RLM4_9ZZZZ